MIKGDTPEAACYNSPEESDYRTPAHGWRPITHSSALTAIAANEMRIIIEVCDICGAMRKIKKQ